VENKVKIKACDLISGYARIESFISDIQFRARQARHGQ